MECLLSRRVERVELLKKRRRLYTKRYRDRHPEYVLRQREASRIRMREYIKNNRQAIKERRAEYRLKYPAKNLWRKARERAASTNVEFTISPESISIPKVCPVLGVDIGFGPRCPRSRLASLDRINPKYGYVPGNVAVISTRANRIKNDGTAKEHELIAKWMKLHGAE